MIKATIFVGICGLGGSACKAEWIKNAISRVCFKFVDLIRNESEAVDYCARENNTLAEFLVKLSFQWLVRYRAQYEGI